MTNRAPATPEQLSELAAGLTRLHFECETVLDLVSTIYGSEDERAGRAQELSNHLQRLRWALERGDAGNDVRPVQKEKRAVPSRAVGA